MRRKTINELDGDLRRVESRLDELSTELRTQVESTVHHAALEQCHSLGESLDRRIDSRFKTAFILAGVILSIFGAFGFFGIRWLVSSAVKDKVGTDILTELGEIKQQAELELGHIEKIRVASEHSPLIVLQTDYGDKSYYMGRLKGVIYNINPNARVEVITSEVADFDVVNSAWILWRASRFYPKGTIFIVVTSPGGLTSSPIIVETMNDHIYIGHDNGCLDLVVENYGHRASYRIGSPELTPPRFSDLFGGVDTFGPAAAKISLGFELEKVGPKIEKYCPKLPNIQHVVGKDYICGSVMDVDKYGNATTNIREADLEEINIRVNQIITLQLRTDPILEVPLKPTYGNVSKGEPVLIIHEGMLQLAINEGNFAAKFNTVRGTLVKIRR